MDNRKKNAGLPIGDRLEHWQSRPIPQRKVMPGHYCSVEPLQPEAHAEQLYQAFAEDTQEVGPIYRTVRSRALRVSISGCQTAAVRMTRYFLSLLINAPQLLLDWSVFCGLTLLLV